MSILAPSNFQGNCLYPIANSLLDASLIQSDIDRVEQKYLTKLFGVALYKLFIADLVSGVPATTKYLTVFNPLVEVVNSTDVVSRGIKEMLQAFFYYEYVGKNQVQSSGTGLVSNLNENSTNQLAEKAGQKLVNTYDDGVETFRAIQFYLEANLATYPEYKGQRLKYKVWHG